MIIYNETTKVEHNIAAAWLEWMKEEHIPAIIRTGCFTHATILEVIETDNTEGPTYAVQYHADSKALYNQYIREHSTALRKDAFDKWGNQFISFRSVLQVVH